MKKILRSVINVRDTIPTKDLSKNLYTLSDLGLEFINQEDAEIWEYVQTYAQTYTQPPNINSVRDYFEKQKKVEVLDRIEEIAAYNVTYKKTDFENLARTALREQNERMVSFLLKDASHILSNGMTVGTGRQKQEYKGYADSIRYLMERADKVLMSDGGTVFRSDITKDAELVRRDFANTLANARNAWGRGTGLNEIDATCRGIKPGELWIHAGSTGELKCASGASKVFDHTTKTLCTLEDLYERGQKPVITALKREGAELTLLETPSSHLVQNGVRCIYVVRTSSGREIEITDNHPLWSSKGGGTWRELKDIEEGDFIGIPQVMRVPQPRTDFSDSEVKLLGYLLGDGSISPGNCSLTASLPEVQEDFIDCLEDLGYELGYARDGVESWYKIREDKRSEHTQWISMSAKPGTQVRDRLESLGLWECTSYTKFVPGELFGVSDRQIELLLGALWSTDGSCHVGSHKRADRESMSHRRDITYASVSKELATGVQSLLLRLGIPSSVHPVHTQYQEDPYVFYTVRVLTNPGKRRFCERIKVVGKEAQFEELASLLPNTDNRMFPTDLFSAFEGLKVSMVSNTGKTYDRYMKAILNRETVSAQTLKSFGEKVPEIQRHLEGEVAWERVESITMKGEEMTYDLSVPEHHSFVMNDVITHNTTFAINWAYKTAIMFGYNVYYYSLEMPVEQLRRIIYVMHSNHPKFAKMGYEPLSYRMIRDGVDDDGNPLSKREIDFYQMVILDIEDGMSRGEYGALFVECPDEPKTTMQMVKSRIELVHQTTPIHLVFIDYLGLLNASRSMGDYREELNSIFRESKQMCLTFNRGERIPIVALHQINREGKKEADKNDGRYTTQALADSSAAERTADVITYTYLNKEFRDEGETLIGCIKNRDNPHFEPFRAEVHFPSRFIKNIAAGSRSGAVSLNLK
jgi:replicative DNA helicase